MKRFIRKMARRVFWRDMAPKPDMVDGKIETAIGFIEETKLEKKTYRENTPCGFVVRVEYYFEARLVRSDVTQVVERMPGVEMFTGPETKGEPQ